MKITYSTTSNGCWECNSHATCSEEYPVATVQGVWDRIHRHSFRHFNGEIPIVNVVRHTCDNKLCVNPNHLILGTHKDNVADRVSRNRSANGERNGRAKLTWDVIKDIRKDTESPKMHLARKHGVDPKTIRQIQQNKIWVE